MEEKRSREKGAAVFIVLIIVISVLIVVVVASYFVGTRFSKSTLSEVFKNKNQAHTPQLEERFEPTNIPDLDFVVDSGFRIKDGALPAAVVSDSGEIDLYYEDTSDDRRGRLVSSSSDGLTFTSSSRWGDNLPNPHALLLPELDTYGDPIYRNYYFEKERMLSESSKDATNMIKDEGVRYKMQPVDKGKIGITNFFVDKRGGVVMLYIGDMFGMNNIRRAYSPPGDNGENFEFDRGDVLNDAQFGGGPRSYVDQKSLVLPDRSIRLFVMKQGRIYSFTSEDGNTFSLDPGMRLGPSDFSEFEVGSLHDPWVVRLPDGRFRMYVAAKIGTGPPQDGPPGTGDSAIVSATTRTTLE